MLPSPSLGPPWLSLSPSPAFLPWGIPDELEPALELVDEDEAAGGDEALELLDEDEPPPQPATASATTARASPNHRFAVMDLGFMGVPLFSLKDRSAGNPS
jgi:hypothetical protein